MTKDQATKSIASVIVNNRDELIAKLAELRIACLCDLGRATEGDLSDIVVENIQNKKLQFWLAEKIASKGKYFNAGADPVTAIANAISSIFTTYGKGLDVVLGGQKGKGLKEQYKRDITNKAIDIRLAQEKERSAARTRDILIITGASLVFLGIGAAIYFGDKTSGVQKVAIAP